MTHATAQQYNHACNYKICHCKHNTDSNLDEVDDMLSAQCLDQTNIVLFVAVVCKNAEMRLALVERLGAFVKATSQTIVNESRLQDLLDGNVQVHRTGRDSNWRWSRSNIISTQHNQNRV